MMPHRARPRAMLTYDDLTGRRAAHAEGNETMKGHNQKKEVKKKKKDAGKDRVSLPSAAQVPATKEPEKKTQA